MDILNKLLTKLTIFVGMRNVYLVSITVLLFFSACRKEKFKTESRWIAPVLETELSLGDLLPDSLLNEDAEGNVSVVFEEEYGVTNLEDILVIPDRVETVEVSLTSLVLDDRSFTDTLTLFELYPPSLLLNGQRTSLESQDIQTEEGTVLDVTEEFFTTATFLEGFIDISISNDLPVTAEILEFELRNEDDKEVIVSGVFNDLLPNTTVSETYDLAGQTVDGVLELIVKRVKTAASDGDVLIEANKGIRTTITVRDLKPQTATAIFPAQNLIERNEETQYEFGGAQLTEVYVKEGYILMKVESSIEEAIILDYVIPESDRGPNTPPISQTWVIPPAPRGETVVVNERFPIAGFRISLYGENQDPGINHNLIYNELTARIEETGIERKLSLEDKVKIEFGLVDVKPILVIGDPGDHEIEAVDSFQLKAFEKLSGNLRLDDAKLDLNFYNSFGIEANLTVNSLVGVNSLSNEVVTLTAGPLTTPVFLEKATNPPLVAFEKDIEINKSNSNLKLFLENAPSLIKADLFALVNPNGTYNQSDFAFDTSQLKVNFKLSVPLKAGLDNFTFETQEEFTFLDFEQAQNIKGLDLTVKASNEFPIDAAIQLSFYEAGQLVLTTESVTVEGAETDPITGFTASAQDSEVSISLDEDQMNLIRSATSVKVSAILNTEGGQTQKFSSDYSIGIKLFLEAVYENQI